VTALGLLTACQSSGDAIPRASFYDTLDESDIVLARSALQDALETRVSREAGTWKNGATGNEGSITTLRTYQITSGTYCRDYREIVTRQGRARSRIRTACRDPNGVWFPVKR
jgi:surface antigen